MSGAARYTAADLEGLPPNIRSQIERHLDIENKQASQALKLDTRLPLARGPGRAVSCGTVPVRKEEAVGRMLVEWIDMIKLPNGLRPGLFFYHIPNGLARTAAMGGIFKAQGLRPGWPDYGLDLPVGRYHGFRLEIKADDGDKPTATQLEILARLESVGYKCAVAWGFDEGKLALERYWHELVDKSC